MRADLGPKWWLSRKSKLGASVAAKVPRQDGQKPWWTSPPKTVPDLGEIEYVASFQAELMGRRKDRHSNAMLKYVADWLKAARRLLHEESHKQCGRWDLSTTDDMIVAASGAMHKMRSRIYGLGGVVDDDIKTVIDVLQGKADAIRRARAQRFGRRVA